MRWRTMGYDGYIALGLRGRRLVRRFNNCIVWSAEQPGRWFLILDEARKGAVTLCEYESKHERAEDITFLESEPPGRAATGIPVAPLMPPPSRFARDARPLPVSDEAP